jgi:hypothetical protein
MDSRGRDVQVYWRWLVLDDGKSRHRILWSWELNRPQVQLSEEETYTFTVESRGVRDLRFPAVTRIAKGGQVIYEAPLAGSQR